VNYTPTTADSTPDLPTLPTGEDGRFGDLPHLTTIGFETRPATQTLCVRWRGSGDLQEDDLASYSDNCGEQ
jgi:hypothetical protein